MTQYLIQVITDEVEIAELLFYDRDPYYAEERLHPVGNLLSYLTLERAFVLSGLCMSLGEARRLAAQGGLYVQNARCTTTGDFQARRLLHGRYLLLRKGKKKIALLELIPVRVVLERGVPYPLPEEVPGRPEEEEFCFAVRMVSPGIPPAP